MDRIDLVIDVSRVDPALLLASSASQTSASLREIVLECRERALARRLGPTAVLAGAALLSASLRLRDGPRGWGLLPPGSTPGIVLSIVVLVACVLLAGALLQGAAGIPSLAPLAVALVAAGRVLTVVQRQPALAAASALALALAGFGSLAATVAGGLVAVALAAFPAASAEEAAG
jgi:hypothetical protein